MKDDISATTKPFAVADRSISCTPGGSMKDDMPVSNFPETSKTLEIAQDRSPALYVEKAGLRECRVGRREKSRQLLAKTSTCVLRCASSNYALILR